MFFSIWKNNKQTAEIYSSLFKKESEKDALNATERSLVDTVDKRKILDAYFIKPEQAVTFIEQVEKLGVITGTKVTIKSVVSPKKPGESFLLDFSAKGKFEDIYRLFGLIDEMPHKVTVKTAAISQSKNSEQDASEWTGSFLITLESYLDK
jgi:hypothetical protein